MDSGATDLLRALDNDEFFPVFQPVVELRTGQLTGFELLSRCHHATLGTIPPDEFIPRIEAAGLTNRMTQSLLEKAFASDGLAGNSLHLAVNLSPIQLQNPDLPAMIAECADRGRFSLNRLTLEVTESALFDGRTCAGAVARQLKEMGCLLALDDFGTGYSSLRHLQSLPFDKLKVDKSFVASMTEVRENRKIVAAVVGLGQSLGLSTVAEGIETPAQASMLLWLGCDLGQGWLYGKPVPACEIPRMLAALPQTSGLAMMHMPDGGSLVGLESFPAERLAQIQAIYDGAPVGLCFLDRNMRYVSLNRRLAEMNGAPVQAHLGKTVAELIPRFFPMVEPFIRRALAGEPVTGVEVERPAREFGGTPVTNLVSYQPARDEAGEVLGVCVAVMDITGHKRTEEALRESLSHFRNLLELGPHVPWVLNAGGEVVEVSSKWEDVTGQPLSEALGNGWRIMLHPEDRLHVEKAISTCLATGESLDVHYRVRTRDGTWLLLRARGSPRFGHSGKILGVYGVVEIAANQPNSGPVSTYEPGSLATSDGRRDLDSQS